jgi:hypothetical protein
MPSLKKMLQSYDSDLLSRISKFWEVDPSISERDKLEEAVLAAMTNEALLEETINLLPAKARKAWETLTDKEHHIPWTEFARKYGDVRIFGPASRERVAPETHPVSAAETLWYRALIGKAFLDIPPEPREFAFIPDELLQFITKEEVSIPKSHVRPLPMKEIKRQSPANTRFLDHMTDWLSSRRMGKTPPPSFFKPIGIPESFFAILSSELGLADKKQDPLTDMVGQFLQADRLDTLKRWFIKWKDSSEINDLLMLPNLLFEGTWKNDPVYARNFVLEQVSLLDVQTWYSLASFISIIKADSPDFQRPAGNYQTWSIRRNSEETFLTGVENWDEIDGAFLNHLITGPIHWLGVLDLAYSSTDGNATAFRLSTLAHFLLSETAQKPTLASELPIKVTSDLGIIVPVNSSRLIRYQIGRFAELKSITVSETRFQITASSLALAQEQGLKVEQLIQLLGKNLMQPLPAPFHELVERWNTNGLEVTIENPKVLRVKDATIMNRLKDHPKAGKMIGEIISPTVAIIHPDGSALIKKVLLEFGILTREEPDV